MSKRKLQIIVCTHKQEGYIKNDGVYSAIQVGKALHPDLNLGYLCDNEGDNISDRNPSWCEWTAIYWAWKNLKDVEYVGLSHYRRYFDVELTGQNIESILGGRDIIAVKSRKMASKRERMRNLCMMTSLEDVFLFIDSLLSIHPDCEQSLLQYFYNSRTSYPFSMFIMKKEMFDEYCNFIFPVLFDVEQRAKEHGYTRQKRSIGYLGEWSLGIFVMYKHLSVRAIPVRKYGASVTLPFALKVARTLNESLHAFADSFVPVPKSFTVPDSVKAGFEADGIVLRKL